MSFITRKSNQRPNICDFPKQLPGNDLVFQVFVDVTSIPWQPKFFFFKCLHFFFFLKKVKGNFSVVRASNRYLEGHSFDSRCSYLREGHGFDSCMLRA